MYQSTVITATTLRTGEIVIWSFLELSEFFRIALHPVPNSLHHPQDKHTTSIDETHTYVLHCLITRQL